jgi:hypothetical protein
MMTDICVPQKRAVTVRQEGLRVVIIEAGQAILDLPYQAALELARAIHIKAKASEELAEADRIAFDQAIILRRGLRFGLTNRPDIQDKARTEAAWNRALRRALPGGIRSQEQVGTPAVIVHEPPAEVKSER